MREMSARTSYSIVRLVFRPYTHIWQTICTSVLLRTSSRVSPAFILHKYSSPSFGSQHIDYKWHPSKRLTFDAFGYASHSWRNNFLSFIFTFIVNIGFESPLFLPTCYTPWSVFQDGIKKVHIQVLLLEKQ